MAKAEEAYGAILYLLRSDKQLEGVEYKVNKKKARGLEKMMDKSWAMNWIKCWDSDAALTKNLLAKMPPCIEIMYGEVKAKALRDTLQIMPRLENYKFAYCWENGWS